MNGIAFLKSDEEMQFLDLYIRAEADNMFS